MQVRIEKILAIQLRRLGDLVLATPAFRALKEAWPAAHLTVVTEKPFDEILEGMACVDQVLVHDRQPVRSLWFGQRLSAAGFDLALDFHGNPTSARLTLQSGAPVRVGWALRGRSMAYTLRVDPPPREPARYTADQKLDLVRSLGLSAGNPRPRLMAGEADLRRADALLQGLSIDPRERFLIAAPASRQAYKEWVPDKCARALEAFRAESGGRIVVAGARSEEKTLFKVRSAFREPPSLLIVESLRDWLGILCRSRLFFGPDGGIKHVAQALDRPTLAFFGPQDPAVWTPPPGRVPHGVIRARRNDCVTDCAARPVGCDCLAALDPDLVTDRLLELWNAA